MAAQQNAESIFEPPTYSQEIFATRNGSYKLFLQVHNFNGYVRIGISKQIWCEESNDYVHATFHAKEGTLLLSARSVR